MRDLAFRKGRHAFQNEEDYLEALYGEEPEEPEEEPEEPEEEPEEDNIKPEEELDCLWADLSENDLELILAKVTESTLAYIRSFCLSVGETKSEHCNVFNFWLKDGSEDFRLSTAVGYFTEHWKERYVIVRNKTKNKSFKIDYATFKDVVEHAWADVVEHAWTISVPEQNQLISTINLQNQPTISLVNLGQKGSKGSYA